MGLFTTLCMYDGGRSAQKESRSISTVGVALFGNSPDGLFQTNQTMREKFTLYISEHNVNDLID